MTVVDASADVFDKEGACLDNGSSSSESKLSSDSVIAWLKLISLSEASTSELQVLLPIIFCTALSFTNSKNIVFDFHPVENKEWIEVLKKVEYECVDIVIVVISVKYIETFIL